jgi:mannose/fructose/N-acetylgalactosamine-specific phosphotransferase system component IIC
MEKMTCVVSLPVVGAAIGALILTICQFELRSTKNFKNQKAAKTNNFILLIKK